MRTISILITCISIQSCAFSIHQHSIGDFGGHKATPSRSVVVDQKDQVIFADFSDLERLDEAYEALIKKCKGGKIVGISTLYATDLGFFSWHERIRLEGTCLR